MKILVTSGNTITPLDNVRIITNVFTGQTGTQIARVAQSLGHDVTLLTSHPELLTNASSLNKFTFRTFTELHQLMGQQIQSEEWDAVIHAAAVADYDFAGAFFETNGTLTPNVSAKIPSGYNPLWLKLSPTPKIVDLIRKPWGFQGTLVKFKLEVGISTSELFQRAQEARNQSDADFIVANLLENYQEKAWIIDRQNLVSEVKRQQLAETILSRIISE